MNKYLVTISWQDQKQPLSRKKETITTELEDISQLEGWEICECIKRLNGYLTGWYAEDIAIDFMMKLEEETE